MLNFLPTVAKARKPRFDVHLKIYDLNNVPLANGVAMVKWYLPHSIHTEHRGRTQRCPVVNHQVEFNYKRIIRLRIGIDKNNSLQECPLEFEVTQEFEGTNDKITLGYVKLNLSEYVEESEAMMAHTQTSTVPISSISPIKSAGGGSGGGGGVGGRGTQVSSEGALRRNSAITRPQMQHTASRKNSTVGFGSGISPSTGTLSPRRTRSNTVDSMDKNNEADNDDDDDIQTPGDQSVVQDGVMRRHLMVDSKVNSTLKIGILMVQVDGDRSYMAPSLKSAPMFGSIAGFVAAEPLETPREDTGLPSNMNKSRETHELQDMYRRALVASWSAQPGELSAFECIEDLFAGGTGWRKDKFGNTVPSHG